MALEAGQVLDGKYKVLRLIGEGGMGAVYEAQHAFLGRRVAIKVLSAEFAHNAEAVKRFYREAQAAARIGHENICEVADIGQTAGSPFIVMQLLQGKSLAAAIVESAPFPVGRAVDIAQQVLEALAAAHAAGIVHRDMKPDNIFLTKVAGREDFVKLLDFGISKVRTAGSETKLTQDGTVLGTPQYMSPEQARGETDVDGRADVWAVGIIVFEMLTGRVPFDGPNYNKIIFDVVSGPIPRLRALREGITPELETVVMRAMERDVARRLPTALAFRDELLSAWMGTGDSGFEVRSAPTTPPSADEAATELAPAMLLAQVKAAKGPVPRVGGAHVAAAEPPATPAAPAPASNIFVAEPRDTAGASSSPSGVPTSPRGLAAAAKLAARGTVEVTPGATVALPGAGTSGPRRGARWIPAASAAVIGAVALGIVLFFALRGPGNVDRAADAGSTAVAAAADAAPAVAGPDAAELTAAPPPAMPVEEQAKPATALEPPTVAIQPPELPQTPAADVSAPAADADAPAVVAPPAVHDAGRPAPIVTEAPRTGTLNVTTIPWTNVYLDDEFLARAPFANRSVAVGSHRLRYVNEVSGIEFEEPIRISAGEVTTIRRTAVQLGATTVTTAQATQDAGVVLPTVPDAGRDAGGIRIRTEVYRRDAG